MATPVDFCLDDFRELERKGLLTARQRQEWIDALAVDVDGSKRIAAQQKLRELFQSELDKLIERIRVQQNQKHEQTLQQSDLIAVAAGGLLGALNAWMRTPVPAPTPVATPKPNLWASAFDAAQASLNVARQRRLLDHMRIHHISGDESTAEQVLLCINGFMTQGRDPSHNWEPWGQGDARVVVYAVLWEAGDVNAWNEFCAHANENIATSAAHDLLTHFTGNPWHKAQDKAEQVGILLAQVLSAKPSFCRRRKINLLGHSLGGAVIYSALQELGRLRQEDVVTGEPLISSVVFFAGAFLFTTQGLATMTKEVSKDGKLVNVFSRRDEVLTKIFWAIQLQGGDAMAAGCAPIVFPSDTQGVNVEVSDLVPPRMPNQFGHSYGQHMEPIRLRVLPHLK